MSTSSVEIAVEGPAKLGEGPCWDADKQCLYWIDILEKQIHRFDPSSRQNDTIQLDELVGFVVVRNSGGLIAGLESGFAHVDSASTNVNYLRRPEAEDRRTRMNDGKCDPLGHLWAGSMDLEESRPLGSLYRLGTDLQVTKMPDIRATISNGLAWTSDLRTMYYIDSPTRQVRAFDCDLNRGSLSNERAVITFVESDGYPDGMTIDADDMLWIAHWGGARVSRWDPTRGKRLSELRLPALNITSCCFGGPQFSDLYVTSATKQMTPSQLAEFPQSGALFRIETDVRGTPSDEYGG